MQFLDVQMYMFFACSSVFVWYSCWIAVGDASKGAIWAFVAPMLVVTVVRHNIEDIIFNNIVIRYLLYMLSIKLCSLSLAQTINNVIML